MIDRSRSQRGPSAVPLSTPTRGRSRTLTAGEVLLLSSISELGTDVHAVESMVEARDRIPLDPALVLPVVLSLAAANPLFQAIEDVNGLVTVAALSHRGTYGSRVHAGDTIDTESEVVALRPSSSRPGHHVMSIRDVSRNQHGEFVMVIDRVVLVRAEPVDLGGPMARD